MAQELVEQLLRALHACLVGDIERAVLAATLDHDTVRELDVQLGGSRAAIAVRVVRLELVAAERPRDCVEHRRFSLTVAPADDRETVLGRLDLHGADAFDVLELKTRNLYRFQLSSPLLWLLLGCSRRFLLVLRAHAQTHEDVRDRLVFRILFHHGDDGTCLGATAIVYALCAILCLVGVPL